MRHNKPLTLTVIASLSLMLSGCFVEPRGAPLDTHEHWYGTVTKVDNCHTRKRGYQCDVYVNGRVEPYHQLDIDDFPGDYVGVGDHIGYQHVVYEGDRFTYMLKNKERIGPMSACISWMPCWDQDK